MGSCCFCFDHKQRDRDILEEVTAPIRPPPSNPPSATASAATTAPSTPTARAASEQPLETRKSKSTSITTKDPPTQTTSTAMVESRNRMSSSLRTAWTELQTNNPQLLEERELQRALELSLLDCALVPVLPSGSNSSHKQGKATPNPLEILRLSTTNAASVENVKRAYRKRSLETHPDKGGNPDDFALVAWAYRTLLTKAMHQQRPSDASSISVTSSALFTTGPSTKALKTTAHWDQTLKAHKDLVAELFADGNVQNEAVAKQRRVLNCLRLYHQEAGSSNLNENQERIRNSCFYLSLAVSYLSGIGALMNDSFDADEKDVGDESYRQFLQKADQGLIGQTALQLKRTIEGAVLQSHPEWAAAGLVGEEVQAFSDFLVYQLQSEASLLRDCAVAIFDETSGFVDIYKGSGYADDISTDPSQDWVQRAHTLTLRYTPGHYQPLLPKNPQNNTRPSLDEIVRTLDLENVFYVVTDGNS